MLARLHRRENGTVLPITAVYLLIAVAVLAVAIDLGRIFLVKSELQRVADAAALTGAMLLLTFSRVDIVEMLEHEVEWPTLVFFIALFMVIAGAEETGLIQVIAEWVRDAVAEALKNIKREEDL